MNLSKGTRVGRWRVLREPSRREGERVAHATCRCDCGVERRVAAGSLRKGSSKSCGTCGTRGPGYRDPKTGPTAHQAKVMQFLIAYRAANGGSPTYEQIAEHFGTGVSTARSAITWLEHKGCVRREFVPTRKFLAPLARADLRQQPMDPTVMAAHVMFDHLEKADDYDAELAADRILEQQEMEEIDGG